MLSLFNLKTPRFLRVGVAVVICLALLHFFSVAWESTSRPVRAENSARPPSSATTRPDADDASPKTTYGFPATVWFSAKYENISASQREWVNSWAKKNPSYRHELLTDRTAEEFVRAHFLETRPDIVQVYEALSIPILRADLLRYLIIFAEGGIWSDLDVACEKPVPSWVPPEYADRNIDMVVGLEFDFEWRGEGTEVASQFCNWVFMAKRSSRNLQVIVDSVVAKLKEIASANGVRIEDLTLDMLPVDVVNVTGPKIMTFSILDSLGQLLGRTVDDRDFHGIKHPLLLGDVLIMPGVSFAAMQNKYPTDQGDPLVTHHYEGSWKQADAEAKERKKQKEKEMEKEKEKEKEKEQEKHTTR